MNKGDRLSATLLALSWVIWQVTAYLQREAIIEELEMIRMRVGFLTPLEALEGVKAAEGK